MAFSDVFIRTTKEIVEESIEGYLFNITVAILILLLGFVLGKLAGRVVSKIYARLLLQTLFQKIGVKRSLEGMLGSTTSIVIYFVSILIALNQLHIAPLVLTIIVVIVITVIVISFLLSVKDFLPNLLAGIFVYRHGVIKEGDRIQVHDTVGTVVRLSLIETQLATKEGDIVFIPNTLLTKNKVIKLASEKK